jgi:hypothetical protein
MKDSKGAFDVLASVEKHIEALKPLLPRQAIVCIGEYPIKTLLKAPGIAKDGPLAILIEKSSDEIYEWIPRGFRAHCVLGFEDEKIETHFWYNVLPSISRDETVLACLKKKSIEKLHGALILSSVWDGVGSASLPALIAKFKASNINSLGVAVLPSKVQPIDAQFNTYSALEMCQAIDGATVVLVDRDHLESYEGVDRQGEPISGNMVANYLVNLFLAKETLVDEVSELSRTFNSKMFTVLLVTGASYKIYGSLENMLNTSLLKPFLTFDMSSSAVLYVLLRMPQSLKDKLPRGKIELGIANWFKEKATLKSVLITEPVYTEDMNDRIDVALLFGGFDTTKMLSDLEKRVQSLKSQAVEKGFLIEKWQAIAAKAEESKKAEKPKANAATLEPEVSKNANVVQVEKTQSLVSSETIAEAENAGTATSEFLKDKEEPKAVTRPRARRTRKSSNKT